ncbi:MAG: hypothetical protein WAX80_00590 [Minisyncoccia bacterium]
MNYWRRKANPLVTLSVLAGGVMSALILFMLARIERDIDRLNDSVFSEKAEILKGLDE